MAKDWRAHGKSMRDTAVGVAKGVGLITGVAVAAHTAMNGFGASIPLLREAHSIIGDLGTALGRLPAEMDNYPSAIRTVVRLNAAVAVLTGTLGLLARATAGLRGVRVITGLLGTFGRSVRALAGPLRLVSSLAFGFIKLFKAFSLMKTVIKLFGALHLAIGLVGGSLHVISGLADSIKDLAKSALLLPAVIGAAGLAMGTFKVATLGVADALKAMDDPAKFAEALKKLSPSARETVVAMKGVRDEFMKIQPYVQEKFFAGLGRVVSDLGGLYLPILQGGLEKVAGSFNRTIKEVAAFFNTFEGSNEVANDFAEGLDFSAKGIDNLLKAVAPLTQALYLLWRVGAEVFAEITGGAEAASKRFLEFIRNARRTGDLRRWMLEGVQAVKDLIAVIINLGRIFATIFDGMTGNSGQSFLGFMRQATDRMLAFLKSAEGQEVLATLGQALQHAYEATLRLADGFVKHIYPAIKAFLPFLQAMSDAVGTGLVAAMAVLGPIFEQIGNALSYLAPILGPIVTVLTFLTATAIGLGVAFGILSKALLLLRAGFLLVRGAVAIFSGLFRLLTGNLGPVGRAVLSLAGFIGRNLLGALRTVGPWLRLLKFVGVVAAIQAVIGALEGYTEAQNKAFAEGNFGQDIKTFWEEFKAQPFEAIGKEFRASLTPPPTVKEDFAAMGTAISGFFTTTLPGIWAKIRASFENDFLGFFAALPGRIGTAISGLGMSLYTSALDAWNQFKLATEQKFVELGGQTGSLPYRLGVALGSLIGMAIKWAQDTWEAFKQRASQKFAEIEADARALPGKIGNAISNLATELQAKAQAAWDGFKQRARQKGDEAAADARALPGKIASGLASLTALLVARAVAAWQGFLASCRQKAGEVEGFVRSIPGRIASALGNMGNLLVGAGRAVINGLLTGIRSAVGVMYDFVSGIAAGIAARKGPISYDRKLLVPAGNAIIRGLVQGMDQAMPGLWKMIGGINTDIAGIGSAGQNFNLKGSAAVSTTAAAARMPVNTRLTPVGSDGAALDAANYIIERVEIPAKDVAEMKSVADFFAAVRQKSRAGRASG